jgi:hypothetical protein
VKKRLRHAGSFRATCARCGAEDIPHTHAGVPYAAHRRGERHRAALARLPPPHWLEEKEKA